MEIPKCPDCEADMLTEEKQYLEGHYQYETFCPNCELAYTWWDWQVEDEE